MKSNRLPLWEFGAIALPLALAGVASFQAFQLHEASASGLAAGPSCADHALLKTIWLAALLGGFAAWRQKIKLRLTVAVTLLLGAAALLGGRFFGSWPFSFDLLSDGRHIGMVAGISAVAGIGLIFRAIWARWIALGLGAAGLMSGVLNAAVIWGHGSCGSSVHPLTTMKAAWPYLVFAGWSAALLATLIGPSLRDALYQRSQHGGIWASKHRVVRVLRWSIFANLVAVPMLLIYGWVQPVVASTTSSAFVLAALLTMGTVLTMGRKVAGAMLLSLAGLGLLAQTFATLLMAQTRYQMDVAIYYTIFWLPAGILSLAAVMVLAKPMRQLLRR